MKKIALFIILTSLFSLTGYAASPIKKYEEVITISKSITLTKVEEFYSDHNMSYSYIKADLTDNNTSLKLLKSNDGSDILTTVPNLAKTDSDTVAALNADFFSVYSGSKGFSLGIEIKDGKLLESPINPSTMATVSYMQNQVLMNYLDFHIMVVAPNWAYNEIRHLNKHTSYYGDILMYTKDFNGGMSPAPGGEVLEVVVEDNKIKEFRRNMPPVKIPENGCVLVVSEGVNMFFANNFAVGDPVKFDYYITPDIRNAETAFGGGAMLVTNGKAVTSYSHTVAGYHPRSAIGIDKSGKTLYLVAVDGRQEQSQGMRMSHLADLLVSLGCYTAVNLDGGGSTNLVASTLWDKSLHTVNSPTENRKVINAVGISYKSEGGSSGISIKADATTIFSGQSTNISATVYDVNKRPLDRQITFTTDNGRVENGKFIPDKAGKATVTATYGSITKKIEFTVIDSVSGIETENYLKMNIGNTHKLKLNIFDNNGNYQNVSVFSPFNIKSSNTSVVSVSNGVLTAHNNGTAIITVEKNGVRGCISVAVGESTTFKPAYENIYATPTPAAGQSLMIGALTTNSKTLFANYINNAVTARTKKYVNYALLGNINKYNSYEYANSLFVNLITNKGGIKATDSSQWDKLVSAIGKTNKNNVFILSDNSIFGNDSFENQVIEDYLASVNKKVFVITPGSHNTYKNIKGVSYFTLGNKTGSKINNTRLENCKYLEFKIGTSVSFEWKKYY